MWEKFDDNCKEAEDARDLAVKEAEKERDQVVRSLPGRTVVHAPERIKAVAKARCERRIKAAQEGYEAACTRAEHELMRVLDKRQSVNQ